MHHARGGAGAEERAGEVDLDHLPPDGRLGAERSRHDRRDPCVTDPHVDAAPLGDGRVGHRLVELLVAHVAWEHEGRTRKRVCHRLEVALGASDERHPRAAA